MNQKLFITTIVLLFALGLVLAGLEVSGYLWVLLALSSSCIFARRYYLKLKPWWGGQLRDIPKYFKNN